MEHRALLAAFLPDVAPAARQAAVEHAARCTDCWRVLRVLGLVATAPEPTDAFGCDGVRDALHELLDGDPDQVARRHPAAVRHLGWCVACRERLVELIEIETAHVDGTLTERLFEPARSAWRGHGAAVRELVGRVVVELRDRVAAFASFPADVANALQTLVPEPSRGAGQSSTARVIRLDLENDATIELAVTAVGTERLELELRTEAASTAEVWIARLRELDEGQLVAAGTVHPGLPIVLRGVPAGRYRLELEGPEARVWWIPLDVTASVPPAA